VTPAAQAQEETAFVSKPAAKGKASTTNVAVRFQASVVPIEDTQKIRVLFNNPCEKAVLITIEDERGRMVYQKYCRNAQYVGDFEMSQLGDGTYSVAVSEITKGGFAANSYTQTFQIGSKTERSLRPINPKLQKNFTPSAITRSGGSEQPGERTQL
jgi:hypothetical protein